MSTLDVTSAGHLNSAAGSHRPVEATLRNIAYAAVVAGLISAAYAAATHERSGQHGPSQPEQILDWDGNSARTRS